MDTVKHLISVNAQPRAKKTGVERISPNEFKVRVLSPPTKGEANKEIIKQLAAYFDVPASQVTIIRGHKSRRKLVAIKNARKKR